jgi:uncharacterized protein YraI
MKYTLALLSTVLLLVVSSCMTSPDIIQMDPSLVTASTQQPTAATTTEESVNATATYLPPQIGVYVSVAEEANVRSGPGTMFEVLGQLTPGRRYQVTGKNHDWLEIQFDNETAWVFSALVTLDGDPSSIPDLTFSPTFSSQATTTFANQETAIAHIRSFLGESDLSLMFVELTLMINSPDADRQIAVFEDQLATRYSVDPSTYALVQIEPSGYQYASGSPVSLDIIRQMAQDIASRSPGFVSLEPTLQYEEGQKNELHFFVWIDTRPGWKFNYPQLQVGISDDGSLRTYMNTLLVP